MTVNIKVQGLETVLKNLQKRAKADDAIHKAIEAIGNDVVARARQEIETSAHDGKPYERNGNEFVASSPGSPPAKETGDLEQHIHLDPGTGKLDVLVVADGAKAVALEYGTRAMAARPFMGPAVTEVTGRSTQKFVDIIEKG